jgi:heterodisulfide reductase subunit B
MAARNICIAEKLEADILTLCSGCYGTLKEANTILKENRDKRDWTNEILCDVGKEFKGTVDVRHLVEVFYNNIGTEKLKHFIKRPLPLRVATHYGCHLIKPTKYREFKNTERPTFFDELITVTGAKSVVYERKMMCCGAGGGVRAGSPDVALDITREKLENINKAGADCIVNACSFCHMQLDLGQAEIKKRNGISYDIPVLHYAQFIGLALGLPPEKLGLHCNVTSMEPVLKILQKN